MCKRPTKEDEDQFLLENAKKKEKKDNKTREEPPCKVDDNKTVDNEDPETLFAQFLEKSIGNISSCVQKCRLEEEKIHIYTTCESQEFREFLNLENFENLRQLFEIHRCTQIDIFAETAAEEEEINGATEKKKEIRVKETISPGSVMIPIKREQWKERKENSAIQDLDNLHNFDFMTIGLPVLDQAKDMMYFATCFHGFEKLLGSNAEASQDAEASLVQDLSTLSAYSKEGVKRCLELSNATPIGRNFVSEKHDLIDIAVIRIENDVLTDENIDLTFLHENTPIEFTIYNGKMKDLKGIKIFMNGCISGFNEGKVYHPEEMVKEKGRFVRVFSVSCPEKDMNDPFRIATHGDSGALIYGYHPATEEAIALGLVHCGNREEKDADIPLVYCSYLAKAVDYLKEKHNINIKCYNQKEKDKGVAPITSQESASAHQPQDTRGIAETHTRRKTGPRLSPAHSTAEARTLKEGHDTSTTETHIPSAHNTRTVMANILGRITKE